jgi:glycosyltransferase involved in cell wall biosynthesis
MPSLTIIDQSGAGSGVGRFVRSLVAASLELPEAESWDISVVMPAVDNIGRPVEWPAGPEHPRLNLVFLGEAPPHTDAAACGRWIEAAFRRMPADVAYCAYPYLSECPELVAPMVSTFYDFNYKRFATWSPELREVCEREIPRWLSACRQVMVSSDFIAAELSSYYPGHEESVRLVRLGVPAAREAPSDDAWRSFRRRTLLPRRYILNVGWIAPHKGQSVLIEALRILRRRRLDLDLVCVGPNSIQLEAAGGDPNDYAVFVRERARDLGIEPGRDLRGLGHVSDTELEMLYRHAALLVMPTLYEAGSFPIREAVMAGCPVVCSDIPALSEDVTLLGGGAVLFEPLDAAGCAAAIAGLLGDPGAAAAGLEVARDRVSQVFDWTQTARGYIDAFERCIDA